MWTAPVDNPLDAADGDLGSDFPGPARGPGGPDARHSSAWLRGRRWRARLGGAAAADPMDRVVGVVIARGAGGRGRRRLAAPAGRRARAACWSAASAGSRLVPWSQVRAMDAARLAAGWGSPARPSRSTWSTTNCWSSAASTWAPTRPRCWRRCREWSPGRRALTGCSDSVRRHAAAAAVGVVDAEPLADLRVAEDHQGAPARPARRSTVPHSQPVRVRCGG